jgi:hypothetical protein
MGTLKEGGSNLVCLLIGDGEAAQRDKHPVLIQRVDPAPANNTDMLGQWHLGTCGVASS